MKYFLTFAFICCIFANLFGQTEKSTQQMGLLLVPVYQDSGEYVITWYAHSGPDIRTIKLKDDMLDFEQEDSIYKISFKNIDLGELVRMECGTYQWFPPPKINGYLDTWVLRNIVRKIEELNEKTN